MPGVKRICPLHRPAAAPQALSGTRARPTTQRLQRCSYQPKRGCQPVSSARGRQPWAAARQQPRAEVQPGNPAAPGAQLQQQQRRLSSQQPKQQP